MKAKVISAAACVIALVSGGAAKADVMYNLVVDSLTPLYVSSGVAPTVSYYTEDGSASVSEVGGGPIPTIINTASGYVSVTINGATSTTGYSFGTLLFSTDGASIDINFLGEQTDLKLSGNINSVSGSYTTDEHGTGCNLYVTPGIYACNFTGHFVQVPEPASLLLLSAGLFSLGAISYRHARNT